MQRRNRWAWAVESRSHSHLTSVFFTCERGLIDSRGPAGVPGKPAFGLLGWTAALGCGFYVATFAPVAVNASGFAFPMSAMSCDDGDPLPFRLSRLPRRSRGAQPWITRSPDHPILLGDVGDSSITAILLIRNP